VHRRGIDVLDERSREKHDFKNRTNRL